MPRYHVPRGHRLCSHHVQAADATLARRGSPTQHIREIPVFDSRVRPARNKLTYINNYDAEHANCFEFVGDEDNDNIPDIFDESLFQEPLC